MSKPTVLAFNMSPESLSRLRFACARSGAAVRPVAPEEYALPLGVLCDMTPAPAEAPAPCAAFSDEMLVMAFFTNQQVNRLLASMKQLRLRPVALKAVLTPTNAAWDCAQLHGELMKEREAFAQHRKPVHQAADDAQG